MTEQGMRLVSLVRKFDNCDLDHNGDELRAFISRGIDNPDTLLNAHISTCGLFALAVWHALEIPHPLLSEPYVPGMAIAWLVQIAHDLGAVRFPRGHAPPGVGALMHYHSRRPSNDDHVEFCLGPVDSHYFADHGGGGRAKCGVDVSNSNVYWNLGRPLQAWYDLEALVNGHVAIA